MDINNKRFLEAIKHFLLGERVQWSDNIDLSDWLSLFKMAEVHNVLPMFYEAVYSCDSYKHNKEQLEKMYRTQVQQLVLIQAIKTTDFLALYRHLVASGVAPVVVKGIVCRSIYPMPDHRASTDEDLYIRKDQFILCHKALLSYGMMAAGEGNINDGQEICYISRRTGLYLEVHKDLFSENSEAYKDLNDIFSGALDRAIIEDIDNNSIYIMEYTDHLMYLIAHAFKHFLGSGFGVRQLCDIVMYANTYGSKVNWERIISDCRKINAEVFTVALFDIGEKYLGFSHEKSCYPDSWRSFTVDSNDLLEEILDSGLYGQSTMSRIHSSNITLNAVAADKKGKRTAFSVVKTIFPGKNSLVERYAYLKKYPVLLPVAWVDRLIKYKIETHKKGSKNSPSESIRMGNRRIELMKKYGILK